MSARRVYDPETLHPVLIDEGPSVAVPLRGYSLRGHAVVGISAAQRAREYQAKYVEANRDAVNERRRVR